MKPTAIGRERIQSDDFAKACLMIVQQCFERSEERQQTIRTCVCYAASVLAADESRQFLSTEEEYFQFIGEHWDELHDAVEMAITKNIMAAIASGELSADILGAAS